ncbi:hypothetical protein PV326_014167, partial [Microctonus aethiopoides]
MCGYHVTPLKYRFIQKPGKQSQWKHPRTVSRRLIEGEQGALGLKESCVHVMLECALEGDRGRVRELAQEGVVREERRNEKKSKRKRREAVNGEGLVAMRVQ